MEALTDCRRPVSGTISLPSRGTFHHSLTVLSAIGHKGYLALPSGLGRFTRDSTSPVLLGDTIHSHKNFTYRTLTHYGQPSQIVQLSSRFITARLLTGKVRPTPQHRTRNTRQLSHAHGLGSSTFARHYSQNIFSCWY